MIQVSAYPTVEWLHTRASDRGASMWRRSNFRNTSALLPSLGSRLKEVLTGAVAVHQNVWIKTPDGEMEVGIVLERGRRRIAICETNRYSHTPDQSDALVLVYGGFESLYRIQSDATASSMHDAVYAVMCERPTWFSNYGRLSVGRKASDSAIYTVNTRGRQSGNLLMTENVRMSRIRLCIANDWVDAFESALDVRTRFASQRHGINR